MTQVAGEIQRRLRSLEDIRHLLRSVRAMSAIRWRRARARLRSAQQYAGAVDQQLALATTFSTALTRGARQPSLGGSPDDRGNTGLVALTSDRGLCGTFNVGLVAHALDFIERERERGKIKVISLGKYGERFFRHADCELLYTQHFPLTHAVSFVEARDIVAKIKAFYEAKAFNTLYLIYNQFISFGRYQRVEVRLLPPDLNAIWCHVQESREDDCMTVPEDLILGTPSRHRSRCKSFCFGNTWPCRSTWRWSSLWSASRERGCRRWTPPSPTWMSVWGNCSANFTPSARRASPRRYWRCRATRAATVSAGQWASDFQERVTR
jgi:ATP synthase F1 gamma subunit